MDDPRWLRLVTIGLVLAALAVGYFLLTGGLGVKPKKEVQTQNTQVRGAASLQPSPSATQSAYSRIVNRTQANIQTLPNTGFPVGLAVVFSVSAMISGLSLRKFPK